MLWTGGDVVSEDVVSEDVVSEDVVSEDAVSEDVVSEDVVVVYRIDRLEYQMHHFFILDSDIS